MSRNPIPFSSTCAAVLCMLVGAPIAAHAYKAGSLTISPPWTNQTALGQSVGGGFMTIANKSAQADRLLGGATPFAARVEVHSMTMDGGVMRMRPLRGGIAIPAGGSLTLAPGGYHIMLIGLKKPLVLGTRVPLTLHFRQAGNVAVALTVQPVAYQGPEMHHDRH